MDVLVCIHLHMYFTTNAYSGVKPLHRKLKAIKMAQTTIRISTLIILYRSAIVPGHSKHNQYTNHPDPEHPKSLTRTTVQ